MSELLKANVRYLTDSGLETTLVFLDGHELPAFAAFPLLETAGGRARLRRYYREHADLARAAGMGFVFEAPTWRANPIWGANLGYDPVRLTTINAEAIDFCRAIAAEYRTMPKLVSGQIGPRGDGYLPDSTMTAAEAQDYHTLQIRAFARADVVTALTMNNVSEAVGIVRAASAASVPVVIAFTVETDGLLATGQPLGEAIRETDDKTGGYASYFMINCCHPEHFMPALDETAAARVRGVRANASCKSHAELDLMDELDSGNPCAMGDAYRKLDMLLPRLAVVGGCCGTDLRHIREIVRQQDWRAVPA